MFGMAERGYGRVVNVSSGWWAFSEGLADPAAYGVAADTAIWLATLDLVPPLTGKE